MDILIIFCIIWGFLLVVGTLCCLIWNRLAKDNPKMEKILFYEDTDRDGNPIEEDF